MSLTIRDVAREAGVSVATVSRVLNAKGPVKGATRRRVLEVVERLRYLPHGAARSLITARTSTVGVVLPDLYGEFFSEVIRGIDLAARRHGLHLLVSSSHSDRSEIEALLRAMRGRVDGLIVMSPDVDVRSLEANLPQGLPTLLLNCPAGAGSFDSLDIDNYGGARAMVEHLAALGHRSIGFIRGPAGNHDARERLRGYHDALRRRGAERSDTLEAPGDFREETGYEAAIRLLDRRLRPTALFAANDAMALGALFALQEAGVAVPEEMALAGFDDIPIARFITPPLTTVRVAISELGGRAVDRLLDAVAGGDHRERRQETIPTQLVVRASCGAGDRARPADSLPLRPARSAEFLDSTTASAFSRRRKT